MLITYRFSFIRVVSAVIVTVTERKTWYAFVVATSVSARLTDLMLTQIRGLVRSIAAIWVTVAFPWILQENANYIFLLHLSVINENDTHLDALVVFAGKLIRRTWTSAVYFVWAVCTICVTITSPFRENAILRRDALEFLTSARGVTVDLTKNVMKYF